MTGEGESWPSEFGHAAPRSARPRQAQTRAPWIITAAAVVVAAVSLVALVVIARSAALGRATVPPPAVSSAAESASTVQERVCGVLKSGYPAVMQAIQDANEFETTPWSDPAVVRVTNVLVRETDGLASELEAALGDNASGKLRAAVMEFITGLRALSMTERDHAGDEQMNGVAALYNRSRHGALQACGLEDK